MSADVMAGVGPGGDTACAAEYGERLGASVDHKAERQRYAQSLRGEIAAVQALPPSHAPLTLGELQGEYRLASFLKVSPSKLISPQVSLRGEFSPDVTADITRAFATPLIGSFLAQDTGKSITVIPLAGVLSQGQGFRGSRGVGVIDPTNPHGRVIGINVVGSATVQDRRSPFTFYGGRLGTVANEVAEAMVPETFTPIMESRQLQQVNWLVTNLIELAEDAAFRANGDRNCTAEDYQARIAASLAALLDDREMALPTISNLNTRLAGLAEYQNYPDIPVLNRNQGLRVIANLLQTYRQHFPALEKLEIQIPPRGNVTVSLKDQ